MIVGGPNQSIEITSGVEPQGKRRAMRRMSCFGNVMFGHKIPLGETDPYESPPALDGPFT